MEITTGLLRGDCLEQLKALPDNSVDSVISDPPYGLEFLGKEWDSFKPTGKVEVADEGTDPSHPFRDGAPRIEYGFGGEASVNFQRWFTEVAKELLRVLKPGGHLLAFGGSRTYHRLACAIEDAGFEIRDSIHWTYGTGFPKSMDISKQLDKIAGAVRTEVIGTREGKGAYDAQQEKNLAEGYRDYKDGLPYLKADKNIYAPASDEAKQWSGWGTALKPSHEPIVVARKPLSGTVAANVLEYGTGGLNIDGTRVGYQTGEVDFDRVQRTQVDSGAESGWGMSKSMIGKEIQTYKPEGRWPANTILTHDPNCETRCIPTCPVAELNAQDRDQELSKFFQICDYDEIDWPAFIYQAKPSKKEKNLGLDGLEVRKADERSETGAGLWADRNAPQQNFHPTVKPVSLMRYLVRLITPPDGIVLDPFLGSGTTAVGAILEGHEWVGCEITPDYWGIIEARTAWANEEAASAPQTLL